MVSLQLLVSLLSQVFLASGVFLLNVASEAWDYFKETIIIEGVRSTP